MHRCLVHRDPRGHLTRSRGGHSLSPILSNPTKASTTYRFIHHPSTHLSFPPSIRPPTTRHSSLRLSITIHLAASVQPKSTLHSSFRSCIHPSVCFQVFMFLFIYLLSPPSLPPSLLTSLPPFLLSNKCLVNVGHVPGSGWTLDTKETQTQPLPRCRGTQRSSFGCRCG